MSYLALKKIKKNIAKELDEAMAEEGFEEEANTSGEESETEVI